MIATGLSSRSEANAAADRKALLPPAPPREAYRVAGEVIGERLLEGRELTEHPRAALRRRLTWALAPAALLLAALAVLAYVAAWISNWLWLLGLLGLPVAAAAAASAFRSLGHGLSDHHLFTRYGTAVRRTVALQRDAVIGWNVTQSPFQRRAHIVTLAATTAAGAGVQGP